MAVAVADEGIGGNGADVCAEELQVLTRAGMTRLFILQKREGYECN
jgi:hypothetical protein